MAQAFQSDACEREVSIEVEEVFWTKLEDIAERMGLATEKLIEKIDHIKGDYNLSSAIRVFVVGALPLPTQH